MWKQLVSINKWMLYTDNGTYGTSFACKNEYICDTCCNLDEPGKSTKWGKPVTKWWCDSTYRKCRCLAAQSYLTLLWPPWPVAHQAPLSMGFPRRKHWSGLPFPSPGDLQPGIKPASVTLAGRFFITEPPGKHGKFVETESRVEVTRGWEVREMGEIALVFQRRQWHPTPVLLPGKSLVGCSPWGH